MRAKIRSGFFDVEKCLYRAMSLFAFASFVSIAAGNIALGIATPFFLLYVYQKGVKVRSRHKGYFYTALAFVGAILLSALFSGDIGRGVKVWADARIWRMMPFLILLMGVRASAYARRILLCAIAGITVNIAFVIYQGFDAVFRAGGFFGHAMTMGGYLSMFVPLLLVLTVDRQVAKGKQGWFLLLYVAACVALIFNGTRGAWLAVMPSIFFILGYYLYRKSFFALLCSVVMVIGGFALTHNETFMARVATINSITFQPNAERFLMWRSAYQMFTDHPILGVGTGQYESAYQTQYILPAAKERTLGHAHNNFMQMLGESGAVGFLGFTVMVGYFIAASYAEFFKTRNPYALMISAVTLSLVLQGMTEYNFGNSAVMKAYWLLMGCLLVMKGAQEEQKDQDRKA